MNPALLIALFSSGTAASVAGTILGWLRNRTSREQKIIIDDGNGNELTIRGRASAPELRQLIQDLVEKQDAETSGAAAASSPTTSV